MQIILQTYEYAEKLALTKIKKNNKQGNGTTLSGLYKHLRQSNGLTYFGDYPLMIISIKTLLKHKLPFNRNSITYMMRNSKEISEYTKSKRMKLATLLQNGGI